MMASAKDIGKLALIRGAEKASQVSEALCTKTIDHSGWPVYSNMEHFSLNLTESALPLGRGPYPRMDGILSQPINPSVGLSTGATEDEIRPTAQRFREACGG